MNNKNQDFALLTTSNLNILLPQSQITHIKHIENHRLAELEVVSSVKDLQAHLELKSEEPCFCSLSNQLSILPTISSNTFIQTTWEILPSVNWCWDEVKWLNQVQLDVQPIHAIFQTSGLPVQGITTLNDGKIAFVSDTHTLLQFVLAEHTS